jgi:hypothetical protein
MLYELQEKAVENFNKKLSECYCPRMGKPCLRDKCWSFIPEFTRYFAEKDWDNSRHVPEEVITGKIVKGTLVQCNETIFQTHPVKVELATQHNGHVLFVRDDGIVCYKDDATPVNEEDRANEEIPLDKEVQTEEEKRLMAEEDL